MLKSVDKVNNGKKSLIPDCNTLAIARVITQKMGGSEPKKRTTIFTRKRQINVKKKKTYQMKIILSPIFPLLEVQSHQRNIVAFKRRILRHLSRLKFVHQKLLYDRNYPNLKLCLFLKAKIQTFFCWFNFMKSDLRNLIRF